MEACRACIPQGLGYVTYDVIKLVMAPHAILGVAELQVCDCHSISRHFATQARKQAICRMAGMYIANLQTFGAHIRLLASHRHSERNLKMPAWSQKFWLPSSTPANWQLFPFPSYQTLHVPLIYWRRVRQVLRCTDHSMRSLHASSVHALLRWCSLFNVKEGLTISLRIFHSFGLYFRNLGMHGIWLSQLFTFLSSFTIGNSNLKSSANTCSLFLPSCRPEPVRCLHGGSISKISSYLHTRTRWTLQHINIQTVRY